jgi:hypothetical protein
MKKVLLLIFVTWMILTNAKASEVTDYISKLNLSSEAIWWIQYNKIYNTTILYIEDGDILYVKNISNKKKAIKKVVKKRVFMKHPNVRIPGSSLDMGGYQ